MVASIHQTNKHPQQCELKGNFNIYIKYIRGFPFQMLDEYHKTQTRYQKHQNLEKTHNMLNEVVDSDRFKSMQDRSTSHHQPFWSNKKDHYQISGLLLHHQERRHERK